MVDLLEWLELAKLIRLNRNVMPDNVDICMSINFISFTLFSEWNFLWLGIFSFSFFILLGLLNIILPLLGWNHFPFQFQSAFTKHFVPRISQINSYLTAIKDVIVAGSRDNLGLFNWNILWCSHFTVVDSIVVCSFGSLLSLAIQTGSCGVHCRWLVFSCIRRQLRLIFAIFKINQSVTLRLLSLLAIIVAVVVCL